MRIIVSAAATWLLVVGSAHAEKPREVTLLLQGYGFNTSESGAEESWGQLTVERDGEFRWTGCIGQLIDRHQWAFGGILRSQSETVTWDSLDTTGSSAEPPEFFLLASSVIAQRSGLESRAGDGCILAVQASE